MAYVKKNKVIGGPTAAAAGVDKMSGAPGYVL